MICHLHSLAEAFSEFSEFFIIKIQKIRDILTKLSQSTKEMTCPPIQPLLKPSAVTLETFTPTTKEEIISIMKKNPPKLHVYLIQFHQTLCLLLLHIAIEEIIRQSTVPRVFSIMYEISHCQACTHEKHTKP